MKEDLDTKLYNDYLNGDENAFELLYNRYKSKIQYFIFNIIKDYEKAEDIAQEVFLYIFQNNSKIECSFKYYIYLISKSRAFTYINKETRRTEIVEEYITSNNEIHEDVLETVVRNENKKEILDALNKLDDKYKNVLYLVMIEGLSYKETSKILGETMQNTKSLIHRGKKQLRAILAKKGFDAEMNKITKLLLSVILVIMLATGTGFAVVKLLNYFEYKTINIEQFENNNGFLYKKISNFEDYMEYKKEINGLLEVTEKEFEDNFVIIIVSERTKLNGLDYKTHFVENDDLYVELIEIERSSENTKPSGVAILISKEYENKNLNIEKVSEEMEMKTYKNLKELTLDYSKEDAIKDKCLIIDQNEKKSYNKDVLETFIKEVDNNNSSELRIYQLEGNKISIQDIRYISNNKFVITYDYTRYSNDLSYETDEIHANKLSESKVESFNDNVYMYTIQDEKKQFTFGVYE